MLILNSENVFIR